MPSRCKYRAQGTQGTDNSESLRNSLRFAGDYEFEFAGCDFRSARGQGFRSLKEPKQPHLSRDHGGPAHLPAGSRDLELKTL